MSAELPTNVHNRMYPTLSTGAVPHDDPIVFPSKNTCRVPNAIGIPPGPLTSVPGIGSHLRILRQGWLYKRGMFYQPWRLRWCVIVQRDNDQSNLETKGNNEDQCAVVLVIYSQRDHANGIVPPKKVIPLSVQLEVEVSLNPVKKTFLDRTLLFPFVFVIHGRKYVLASNHRKDREDWIHLVQSISDSPLAIPKPISAIPGSEDCSVLEGSSVVNQTSIMGSSVRQKRMIGCSTLAEKSDSSTVSQLGFSMRADVLSLADTDVFTVMELSEVGKRLSTPKELPFSNLNATLGTKNTPGYTPNHPWNEMYQRLCNQPCPTHQSEVQRDLALAELLGQFSEVAQSLTVKIIDSYHTHTHPTMSKDSESWIFGNIVASMAADYSSSDQGLIRSAVRMTSHELQGTNAIASVESDLHTPLMCLIDYKGFRIVCSAAVPLDPDDTLVLDLNKGKVDVSALEKLAEASSHLNLAEQPVGSPSVQIRGSGSCKLHYARSHDHYYATFLSEMFPVDHSKPERAVDPSKRLRPEFVAKYKHPLSPNAFPSSNGIFVNESDPEAVAARKEVVYAARFLRDNHITDFVARLDCLELLPCDSIGLSTCLHSNGINIRYLGLIATRTRLPAVKELCLVDMVARAAKEAFQSAIRGCILNFRRIGATKIESELIRVSMELLNSILIADEKIWEGTLKSIVQRKFSFVMSYDIFRTLHRPGLLRSTQYHCCIDLDNLEDVQISLDTPVTERNFRGFYPRPKISIPKKTGRIHLTTPEDRSTYDLAQHLSLRGPRSKLVACQLTQRRLLAIARTSLACGRVSDAVKYATAATKAGPWKISCGTARAWVILAEAAWTVNQGCDGNKTKLEKTDKYESEPSKPSSELTSPSLKHHSLEVKPPRPVDSNETLVESRSTSTMALTIPAILSSLPPVEELIKKAIDTVVAHWGPDHPLIIDFHVQLAKTTEGYSPSQALEHHARALRTSVRSLGRTHQVTARIQLAACLQLVTLDRAQEAVRMANDALTSLGEDDKNETIYPLERALAHSVLAEAHGVLGDLVVARSHASKSRSLRERILGWLHVLTADACAQVAELAIQSAALAEHNKAEIVTPAARSDVLTAVEAYSRVFKYLKSRTSFHRGPSPILSLNTTSTTSQLAHPFNNKDNIDYVCINNESTMEYLDESTALSGMILGKRIQLGVIDQNLDPVDVWGNMLRKPHIISPKGQPANAALLNLAKMLVNLKLRVLSQAHQQHVRTARQCSTEGMTAEGMRDIMSRLVGLTPSVFLDDCVARADEGDMEAIHELSVVISLSEKDK